MGGLDIYDLEDVSHSIALDAIEATEAKYYVAGSESYSQKFIPECIAPKIEGTREASLGYIGDGEWVLLKPNTNDIDEIAASHIGAQAVLEETELNFPKMDYSENNVIIEHVGELESPVSALNNDAERYSDFIEAIAGKAILGDNDLGGNIGFANDRFYIYDFDRAGSTINRMEEPVYDYIRLIETLTEIETGMQDVERAMKDLAWSFDLSELESKIDPLLSPIHQSQTQGLRLEAEDFIYNIKRVRDGEFFNKGHGSMIDNLDQEDETEDSGDTLKQNIQKAMLD